MFAWQRRKAVIVAVATLAVVATGFFVGIRASRSPARPATVAAAITGEENRIAWKAETARAVTCDSPGDRRWLLYASDPDWRWFAARSGTPSTTI
jgi:hypothetical protein